MHHFEKHDKYYGSMKMVLTRDEMIGIFAYIIIHTGIPDMISQLELINAFASEYMTESPDGCNISRTYI